MLCVFNGVIINEFEIMPRYYSPLFCWVDLITHTIYNQFITVLYIVFFDGRITHFCSDLHPGLSGPTHHWRCSQLFRAKKISSCDVGVQSPSKGVTPPPQLEFIPKRTQHVLSLVLRRSLVLLKRNGTPSSTRGLSKEDPAFLVRPLLRCLSLQ